MFIAWFLLLMAAVSRATASDILDDTQARQYVSLLYDGFVTNREKFPNYTCRCRTRIAYKLDNIEAILRGSLPHDTTFCEAGGTNEAELICTRSGKIMRWKYITDIPSGRNIFPYQFCFTKMDVLCDGKYFLKAYPRGGFATVMGEIASWPAWDADVHGPWEAIKLATSPTEQLEAMAARLKDIPQINVSVKRNMQTFNRSTTHVVMRYESTEGIQEDVIAIDESCGYIPIFLQHVRYEFLKGPERKVGGISTGITLHACTDIQKVKGGWWPMCWVYAQRPGQANSADELWKQREQNILALEIQVLDIDLNKPKHDMLTVTLPADSAVRSPFDDARLIRFREPTRIAIQDIPGLLACYYGQAGSPTAKSPWRGLILSSAVIVVGTLLLVWIFYRRFRQG